MEKIGKLTRIMQFLAWFIIEGVESLERMASPVPPAFTLEELRTMRTKFEAWEVQCEPLREPLFIARVDEARKKISASFVGRGDMDSWTPEVLDEIDKCFVETYMENGEPVSMLFQFLNDEETVDKFRTYYKAVDKVLVKHAKMAPKYAREYFTQFTIWRLFHHGTPIPLLTASVVKCLHDMASSVREGIVEVSICN